MREHNATKRECQRTDQESVERANGPRAREEFQPGIGAKREKERQRSNGNRARDGAEGQQAPPGRDPPQAVSDDRERPQHGERNDEPSKSH